MSNDVPKILLQYYWQYNIKYDYIDTLDISIDCHRHIFMTRKQETKHAITDHRLFCDAGQLLI